MSLILDNGIFEPIGWKFTIWNNHAPTWVFDVTLARSRKKTFCAIKFLWRTEWVKSTLFLWRWCLINIVILIIFSVFEKLISRLLWTCHLSFLTKKFLMQLVGSFDIQMIFKHQVFCFETLIVCSELSWIFWNFTCQDIAIQCLILMLQIPFLMLRWYSFTKFILHFPCLILFGWLDAHSVFKESFYFMPISFPIWVMNSTFRRFWHFYFYFAKCPSWQISNINFWFRYLHLTLKLSYITNFLLIINCFQRRIWRLSKWIALHIFRILLSLLQILLSKDLLNKTRCLLNLWIFIVLLVNFQPLIMCSYLLVNLLLIKHLFFLTFVFIIFLVKNLFFLF